RPASRRARPRLRRSTAARRPAAPLRDRFPRLVQPSAGAPALGLGAFEGQSEAGSLRIGVEAAVRETRKAVKQQPLDADVIVEVFDVRQLRRGAADLRVDRWRAVRGEW